MSSFYFFSDLVFLGWWMGRGVPIWECVGIQKAQRMAFSHDEGTVAVHGDACLFFFAPEKTKENQKNAFEKLTLKFFRLVVNGG